MSALSTNHKVIFFTNNALILLVIRDKPEVRIRDIAHAIGITERAVQRLVEDLIAGGYLLLSKAGRRNTYQIDPDKPLGIPFSDCLLSELLNVCPGPHPALEARRPAVHETE